MVTFVRPLARTFRARYSSARGAGSTATTRGRDAAVAAQIVYTPT
jgi:hypothetical protein